MDDIYQTTLCLDRYILVPFGKNLDEEISFKIKSTAMTGIELLSNIPCVKIDLEKEHAIRFSDIQGIFSISFPLIEDGRKAFEFVNTFLLEKYKDLKPCQLDLLRLYFNCCVSLGEDLKGQQAIRQGTEPGNPDNDRPFQALMPLPNAHLYIDRDVETGDGSSRIILADFLFWTGKRFIAIELLNDKDPKYHIERVRKFLRNGIEPVMIFEEEIKKERENALCRHLPADILNFWLHCT